MVLFGWVISSVVSRSVGDCLRPDSGGGEAAVAKEIDGEGGGSLEGHWSVFVYGVHTAPIFYIYMRCAGHVKEEKKE